MITINDIKELKVGDYILHHSRIYTDIIWVYQIVKMNDIFIEDRKFIYTSIEKHIPYDNSIMGNSYFINNNWYLLNDKEINSYIKLSVFE